MSRYEPTTVETTTLERSLPWAAAMAFLVLMIATSMALAAPGASNPERPQLGVVVQQVPFDHLHAKDLSHGVAVSRVVPDSAADEAGIEGGDILIRLEDEPIYSPARLQWLMGQLPVDETLELRIHRDGAAKTLEVTLAAPAERQARRPSRQAGIAHLGIAMTPLTPGLRQGYGVPRDSGVLVSDVEKNGPAHEAGVKAGDVLMKIDRRTIHTPVDVLRAVYFFDPGDEVTITLLRDGEAKTVETTLGRAEPRHRPRQHSHHPYTMPPGYGQPVHPMPMMPYPYGPRWDEGAAAGGDSESKGGASSEDGNGAADEGI
ncbi:MAG: PDZ domain-containing protein [Gammaproteobacteria bacterium]|nr:PDZ domain-containing protein [Gammaproteobacteria bacterium]